MKRLLAIGLISLCLLSVPGCWDLVELNEIGLVLIIGIDNNSQGDGFEVTVHIHNPTPGSQGGDGGNEFSGVVIHTTQGQTIMDALRNLHSKVRYKLAFNHTHLILIGEDLARQGIAPVLDFCLRTREMRINSLLFICHGSTKDYLRINPEGADSLQVKLENVLGNEAVWIKSHSVPLYRFIQDLLDPGKQPVASRLIALKPEPGNPIFVQGMEKQIPEEVAVVQGLAVFNEDKLVDWLTGTETMGYKLLTGQPGTMILVVPWRGGLAALEATLNSSAQDVFFHQGIPTYKFSLFLSMTLVEYSGYADLNKPEILEELRNLACDQVENILGSTVNKVKDLKLDFVGFGGIVSRQEPEQWAKIKARWGEVLPQLEITYDIRTDILRSGIWTEPLPR